MLKGHDSLKLNTEQGQKIISTFCDTLITKDVLKDGETKEESPNKVDVYDLVDDEMLATILEQTDKTKLQEQYGRFKKENLPKLEEYIYEFLIKRSDGLDIVKLICEYFGVSKEDIEKTLERSFLKLLDSGWCKLPLLIRDHFELSKDFLESEQAKDAINRAFWRRVSCGWVGGNEGGEVDEGYRYVKAQFALSDNVFTIPDGDNRWEHIKAGLNAAAYIVTTHQTPGGSPDHIIATSNLLTFIRDFNLDSVYVNKELSVINLLSDPTDKNLAGLKNLREVLADYYSFNVVDYEKTIEENLIRYVNFFTTKDKFDTFQKDFPEICATVIGFLKNNQNEDVADYIVENLTNISYVLEEQDIKNILLCSVQNYSVATKFKYANSLEDWKKSAWFLEVFTEAESIISTHQENSDSEQTRLGGFSDTDPYENDPWRFTSEQAVLSTIMADAIKGDTEAIKELRTYGLNFEVTSLKCKEIKNKIDSVYKDFLKKIFENQKIKDNDKKALISPELVDTRVIPLLDNVCAFVARYVVQKIEADPGGLSSSNMLADIGFVVEEGFNKYIKVHEVEIPLYDKLYEEFDNLREIGRYPLEVFLGRDGIYAWIGRRSQDIARRRKLGLEGRRKLREIGEVVEINPQYTVYPRYFRDNLSYETKRKFLEQEGISSDADPLFYDTGYTGTIPEQIMRVMDFSDEEIEKRIKLLSAPSANRRVKGIGENARRDIIEYIEHNSKTEETAEGLIVDQKTGKIRHIAKPTSPEEQFYFMMIKQAISRHYWIQEKLHHEPSGNINLDSENYTIRVRQEYAKSLPPNFIKNPKDFLIQQGELLKGSNGGGKYPDEEVILFKMMDGTEIVAKKIELRKAKEARKEFSILISAKKAGLPTAEPVGFISGKEEKDGSYLLMKKLEGVSGRNFDKYLKNLGKFTEDQMKAILRTVAEKNKEMAELFRDTLKIDKRWRIKDTIIELNEETGEVGSVTPIDWERAQNFNPSTPKEIDEIV